MANVMDLPSFGAAEGGRAGCLERLIGINVIFRHFSQGLIPLKKDDQSFTISKIS